MTERLGVTYIYNIYKCLREVWECIWTANKQEGEKHQETDLRMERL